MRKLKTGETLTNKYQIIELIGRGGMGSVYKAKDIHSGGHVAIKTIPPEVSESSSEMQGVRENFAMVNKLNHPNIANTVALEYLKDEEEYFIVMEFCPGTDLKQYRRARGGKLKPEDAFDIASQIAKALDYSHSQRVLHRDIKPQNVLIQNTKVKVLDFGLAKEISSSFIRVSNKIPKNQSGTRPYMSPEQWKGLPKQEGPADQYALAVLLYELLTGDPPFQNDDVDIMRGLVLNEQPRPVPGLQPFQNKAIIKALAKKPESRFSKCEEFINALTEVKKPLAPMIAAGVALFALIAGMAWYYLSDSSSSRAMDLLVNDMSADILKKYKGEQGKKVAVFGFVRRPGKKKVPLSSLLESRFIADPEMSEEFQFVERFRLNDVVRKALKREGRFEGDVNGDVDIQGSDYALTGEIIINNGMVEISARIISIKTSAIQTAAMKSIPIGFFTAEQLGGNVEVKVAVKRPLVSGMAVGLGFLAILVTGMLLYLRKRAVSPDFPAVDIPINARASRPSTSLAAEKTAPSTETGPEIPGEPEMVFVEGGCFKMGDTFGDGESDEKPVHKACVDDFYLGKYEVTQGEWKKVMGSDNNPSESKKGDNYPVEEVSWDDVQEYIRKLNAQTGEKYRLPTEAEWEYAARSGGKEEKWAGTSSESELDQYAWYSNNSDLQTHPVGQKRPNGLGLFDMSGNVHEWCSDWYGFEYYESSPTNNPVGSSAGEWRVLRGGSWLFRPTGLRASYRYRLRPGIRSSNYGFRLAQDSN